MYEKSALILVKGNSKDAEIVKDAISWLQFSIRNG